MKEYIEQMNDAEFEAVRRNYNSVGEMFVKET
jgi:hypothetical protein